MLSSPRPLHFFASATRPRDAPQGGLSAVEYNGLVGVVQSPLVEGRHKVWQPDLLLMGCAAGEKAHHVASAVPARAFFLCVLALLWCVCACARGGAGHACPSSS